MFPSHPQLFSRRSRIRVLGRGKHNLGKGGGGQHRPSTCYFARSAITGATAAARFAGTNSATALTPRSKTGIIVKEIKWAYEHSPLRAVSRYNMASGSVGFNVAHGSCHAGRTARSFR